VRLRRRVYEIVEDQKEGDRLGGAVKLLITSLIVFSVVSVVLETVPEISGRFGGAFKAFELFTVAVFSIEYVLRIWACTADPRYAGPVRGRLRMMFTPMALIDLAAVLPFYLPMVTGLDLRFVRALRLLRLLRVFKLGRYSESLKILANVLRNKKEELAMTVFAAGVLLIVFSSLMYYIENDAQPDRFSSIPAAMWWGVATLTTVGYGDIFPITVGGKILGALSALVGIGMFALPAGILGSGFIDEMHRRRTQVKSCPHCGKPIE
jgi:voltage-gated potassium channel